tara:strand:- start:685 stop:840 length:156 start_codon:yes stop_codon:yes gene_type:complete
MTNSIKKILGMGVFNPHFGQIEQNENKENGKSAENKGFFIHYLLENNPNLC